MLTLWILLNKQIRKNKADFIILYSKIKPYLTWHFLLCFGIAWMITNGWCYIFIILGSSLSIKWMYTIGVSYLAFLWLPTTPEKIITIPIAYTLVRKLFPNDFHTLKLLNKIKDKENGKNEVT